jgi:hypothetical protein
MNLNKSIKIIITFFVILYGALFVLTFLSPHTIEKEAQSFIAKKISERTHERIDKIGSGKIFKSKLMLLAKKKMKKEKAKLLAFKIMLHEKADEKLAKVMTKMSDKDSACRKKHQKFFHGILTIGIKLFSNGIKKIEQFMSQSYMLVMQKVLDDFKIFIGSNFFVLALLLLLLHIKPLSTKSLEILAGLMLVSTLISSYFYIFNQNWFFTLIFDSYVGFGYLVYLGILFGFLVDIGLNKARVTTNLFNGISSPSIC